MTLELAVRTVGGLLQLTILGVVAMGPSWLGHRWDTVYRTTAVTNGFLRLTQLPV